MTSRLSLQRRFIPAVRYLLLIGIVVGVVGVAGRLLSWPLLTSSVGPTAYVFAAHPSTEMAKVRNAVLGHAAGVGAGALALYVFGISHHPSISSIGSPTWSQVAASVVAVGLTLFILEMLGSHHAPAAATTLLIATGLAKPGSGLIGLVLGLAIVIVTGPLIAKFPFGRAEVRAEQAGRSQ